MITRRGRTRCLLAVAAMTFAACSGGDSDATTGDGVDGDAVKQPVGEDGDDAGEARDSGEAGRIEMGLQSLPLAVYDLARIEGNGTIEVSIADVGAVAASRGLDAPSAGRDAENDVVGWTVQLSRGVDESESEVTLLLPARFQDLSFPIAADEELGLEVGAMERYASISAQPIDLLVLSGDLGISASLPEVAAGVLTFGEGEDFDVAIEGDRSIDRLGRATRLAEGERSVAISTSTAAIEAWVAGGKTLADDEDLLAVARALDEAGAVGALMFEGDFTDAVGTLPEDNNSIPTPITVRFGLVALSMTVDEQGVGNAAAYVFEDEAAAEEAMAGVEAAWTDGSLRYAPDTSIDQFVDLESIDRSGNVVTVQFRLNDGRDTAEGTLQLLLRREAQFVHV